MVIAWLSVLQTPNSRREALGGRFSERKPSAPRRPWRLPRRLSAIEDWKPHRVRRKRAVRRATSGQAFPYRVDVRASLSTAAVFRGSKLLLAWGKTFGYPRACGRLPALSAVRHLLPHSFSALGNGRCGVFRIE